MEDPSSATQADVASAYLDMYDAWEAAAANLEEIRKLLQAQEKAVKQGGKISK